MPVLVSAVIITHNRLSLLKNAIQSVLSQTYKSMECIVVDDASSDGTKQYCLSLDTITYIRIEPDESRGGNYARNRGIKQAKGDYIALLDDDDEWLPDKTEKQADFLNRNRDVGMVYCGFIIKKTGGGGETREKQYPIRYFSGDMRRKILYVIPCITSTMMIRRELLFEAGLFDEQIKYWQETELMIRLCQITKIDFIRECLIIYLKDAGDINKLSNKYAGWQSAAVMIYNKHKALYDKLNFFEKMLKEKLYYAEAMARCLTVENRAEYLKNKKKHLYYSIISLPCRVVIRLARLLYECFSKEK